MMEMLAQLILAIQTLVVPTLQSTALPLTSTLLLTRQILLPSTASPSLVMQRWDVSPPTRLATMETFVPQILAMLKLDNALTLKSPAL
jgi:hypothetical protein